MAETSFRSEYIIIQPLPSVNILAGIMFNERGMFYDVHHTMYNVHGTLYDVHIKDKHFNTSVLRNIGSSTSTFFLFLPSSKNLTEPLSDPRLAQGWGVNYKKSYPRYVNN